MRRFNLVFLLILIVVLGVIEFYTYSALRFATRNLKPGYRNWITGIYIVITILWLVAVFATPLWRQMILSKALKNVMISFVMGFLITKVLIALILFIDDIRRVVFWALQYTGAKSEPGSYIHQGMSRSQFMVQFALLFGGTIFGSLLYGMTNRYNYQIRKIKLAFKDLPESFRNLRIIHISDIHSGSLIDKKAVEKGIQMIMDQKPDLILFTGDLVNDRHEEAIDFVPIFSQLKAPLGVYSVLGNHDYGDYVQWPSQTDKINNLNALKDLHRQMGWRLLLDEHHTIQKGEHQIALLGVQNTSFKSRFHTYGDLNKAYQGSEDKSFKILMSHDPSHWDGEINQKYKDIHLTLSGHTHGMQFGVEIPWLKWSPVQYIYKQWAGLYQQDEQYLYVNRGFGFLGYPGRVGIMPEITLIELA